MIRLLFSGAGARHALASRRPPPSRRWLGSILLLGSALLLSPAVLSACSDTALPTDPVYPNGEANLRRRAAPLVGGEVDADHAAVMLLEHRTGFRCTGSVIHTEAEMGYLLTAAHCVTTEDDEDAIVPLPPREFLVIPGLDPSERTAAFSVRSIAVAPHYSGTDVDDLAIVRFFSSNAPAPATLSPLLSSEDDLALSDELVLVGYGPTSAAEEPLRRNRLLRSIGSLEERRLTYAQDDGKGGCGADRGGPALVESNGVLRIAAIISSTSDADGNAEGECPAAVGVATRVSAYERFIADASAP